MPRGAAAAERFPQVFAAIGRHPNEATGFDDADLAELRALAAHPRCLAIGETGLDYFRDGAPRADQERAFDAQIELARESASRWSSTRAPPRTTRSPRSATRAGGLDVILHCFSMPDRLDECVAHGLVVLVRGQRHLPQAPALAGAAARVPADRLLVETDAPYLTPQVVRKERNQPAFVAHTARFVAERRGIAYEELEALVEPNAAAALRMVKRAPRASRACAACASSACGPTASSARTSSSTRTSSA